MQWLEQPFPSAAPPCPAHLGRCLHGTLVQLPFLPDFFLSCSPSTKALPVTSPPVFRRSRAGKCGSCRAGFIGVFPVHEASTFLHPWNLGVGHRGSCQIWTNFPAALGLLPHHAQPPLRTQKHFFYKSGKRTGTALQNLYNWRLSNLFYPSILK